MSRKWANASAVLIAMSKAVEKRMWPFEHPLTQSELSQELLYNLQRWADELSVVDLATQTAAELGQLIHLNERHGTALLNAAKRFPTAQITYSLRPLTSELLKIVITIRKAFDWSSKLHGHGEPFWIWVEDAEGTNIIQWAHLFFRQVTEALHVEFIVPVISSAMPPSVTIRFISDKWLGAEEEVIVDMSNLKMPQPPSGYSPLLNIPFLDFKPLRRPDAERGYSSRYNFLNGMQTQSFWTLRNSSLNTLICAPSASGKTLSAHIAIW
jgi:antiviral helicase SLH1